MKRSYYYELSNAMLSAPVIADDTARIPLVGNPSKPANAVITNSVEEFSEIYVTATTAMGLAKSEADITDLIDHEIQHVTAGTLMNLGQHGLGVKFALIDDGTEDPDILRIQPFTIFENDIPTHLSGVKRRALVAYPQVLSPGDVAQLAQEGYDVDRVGYETVAHNQLHAGDPVPVPLSYNPMTAVHIFS